MMRAPRPKIAATLVVINGTPKQPKILMGQRSARHDFMPNVYVFPGGRVDRADSYASYDHDLSRRTERILETVYTPRKARAIALAAIRETWEETGLMIGTKSSSARKLSHPSYDEFRKAGLQPDLQGLEVFGRAITPPHRHKRFDTWFFVKYLGDSSALPVCDSQELQNVGWFSFDQIKTLELQRATTMMLSVLQDFMRHDNPPQDILFSRAVYGKFKPIRFP